MADAVSMLLVLLVVVMIICVVVILYALYVNSRNIEIVKKNSKQYNHLLSLNKKFIFDRSVKPNYPFKYQCDKKRDFDRMEMDDYIKSLIEEKREFFEDIISRSETNVKNYDLYLTEYHALKPQNTAEDIESLNISLRNFLKIEKKLYAKTKVAAVVAPSISCTLTYVSPQGRNRYKKSNTYSFSQLIYQRDEMERMIENRDTRQYLIRAERSKMTDSMRYNVLKRDGYKCCICGATASDGVRLHVDHIFPVSKGGKTEISNLQTLCERCNVGKGNKI